MGMQIIESIERTAAKTITTATLSCSTESTVFRESYASQQQFCYKRNALRSHNFHKMHQLLTFYCHSEVNVSFSFLLLDKWMINRPSTSLTFISGVHRNIFQKPTAKQFLNNEWVFNCRIDIFDYDVSGIKVSWMELINCCNKLFDEFHSLNLKYYLHHSWQLGIVIIHLECGKFLRCQCIKFQFHSLKSVEEKVGYLSCNDCFAHG